jgi:lipoprotein-anchoring transpeptidase ErfK/SrfK
MADVMTTRGMALYNPVVRVATWSRADVAEARHLREGEPMRFTNLPVVARLAAAGALLAALVAGFWVAPGASASRGFAFGDTSGSVPASSTPSSPTPKPKPKPVDKRPKAPKFITKKGKAIYIDRRHQRVYLYFNGRQIDKFKCSTSSTLPRRGTYHMMRKRKQSWSFNGAVTFYWQVIFAIGPHGHNIAFHSIPVNSSGHEIAPVGQPVSHGCVRVPYKKAKFIYFWITKKTPIVVRP